MSLLVVNDLRTAFRTVDGDLRAVDGISFSIEKGRILAVVGESGSGKSVTALSIMRLLASPPAQHPGGSILLNGVDLLKASEHDMMRIRGAEIGMVFQDPQSSLNPVFTCGEQVVEAIRLHRRASGRDAWKAALEMFRAVGIPSPESRMRDYPHQLSGGMRQRVMIAMALSCRPALLIADEPTTALDVTVQAEILDLLRHLRDSLGMAVLFITHDLGVVSELADEVFVMYAGRGAESGPVKDVLDKPRHPYTRALLRSVPSLEQEPGPLPVIEGTVPNPRDFPSGCRFHPRCPYAQERCSRELPEMQQGVACLRAGEI